MMRGDSMFCKKCGALLVPKKEGNKRVMSCSCGYKETNRDKMKLVEKTKESISIEVVHKEEAGPNPLVDATCPKCKHGKAYFWAMQTRAADEPETKFYKCEKCKHTWRDYN